MAALAQATPESARGEGVIYIDREERAALALLRAEADAATARAELARCAFETRCKELLNKYRAAAIDGATGAVEPLQRPFEELTEEERDAARIEARERFERITAGN